MPDLKDYAAERAELLKKLAVSTNELGHALDLLQRLNSQVEILQKENSSYQWKLNRILNSLPGRLALWVYRLLRKVKALIRRKI
jgi:biopolymer transport protein ExbB/TolQ